MFSYYIIFQEKCNRRDIVRYIVPLLQYSMFRKKSKEETAMKTITYRTNGHPIYPNAAAKGYKLNRLLDYLLTGAAGFGIVTALLFLVSLN